jgi:hypothetical protein
VLVPLLLLLISLKVGFAVVTEQLGLLVLVMLGYGV